VQLQRIGVVGFGLMGHGIAQVAAWPGGFSVIACDADDGALERGRSRVEKSLAKVVEKAVAAGKLTEERAKVVVERALQSLETTTDQSRLADCDLVIEAIVEDLEKKRELFATLERVCRKDAVLATNTSSLPVREIAAGARRPERFVGLHFFNPVQLMRLVEVARTEVTADSAFTAAKDFAERCGKSAIACRDTPGFVVNRLLVPLMAEAIELVERGDASADDVDLAMQLGAGHPMGPITLADYVGLDTTLLILEGWVERHPDEPAFRVPRSLRQKVAAGKLGRKSGEGFYRWDGDKRA
jgi:3-hydroxyacyl-CoA dehydrogenase